MDRDAYLLEPARYIVLNAVHAGIVKRAGEWRWSGYWASVGRAPAPFLAADGLRAQFAKLRSMARARLGQYLTKGVQTVSRWKHLHGQEFLGDDWFVEHMQKRV